MTTTPGIRRAKLVVILSAVAGWTIIGGLALLFVAAHAGCAKPKAGPCCLSARVVMPK